MMSKALIKIVSIVLVLSGCIDNPLSPGNETGPILFVSDRDGQDQIYAMNEDGGNQKRIIRSNFRNYRPRWSRDGKFIIFNSRRSENIHFEAIVMANASGGNEKVLLEHGVQPVFSPTGDMIVFSYDMLLPGYGGNYNVVFYDLAVKSATIFEEDVNSRQVATDWSPDGRYLLVESWEGTTPYEIVWNLDLINLADSSRTRLTNSPPRRSIAGHFSPDGMSIAYISQDSSSADRYIRVMNIDGTGDRVLETRTLGTEMHRVISLAWSPDGSKIVFVLNDGMDRFRQGLLVYNIYSIHLNGTGIKQLTTDENVINGFSIDWRW